MRLGTVLVASATFLVVSCSKPEPPKITPRSIHVGAVTPTSIGLSLELDVENPNPFPLLVRTVDGTLKIGNGVELGSGQAQPAGSIPAHGSRTVPSDLSVKWTNVGALAPLATSPKPVPYVFEGTAKVGGEKLNLDIPFTIKGELTRQQILAAGLRGLGGIFAAPQ
jgi:LEA14-like dessication related protein